MIYLLCTNCKAAWTAPVASPCHRCGALLPLIVSPWSSDARVWFRTRMGSGDRAAEVIARANYTEQSELRETLWTDVRLRGRDVTFGAAT